MEAWTGGSGAAGRGARRARIYLATGLGQSAKSMLRVADQGRLDRGLVTHCPRVTAPMSDFIASRSHRGRTKWGKGRRGMDRMNRMTKMTNAAAESVSQAARKDPGELPPGTPPSSGSRSHHSRPLRAAALPRVERSAVIRLIRTIRIPCRRRLPSEGAVRGRGEARPSITITRSTGIVGSLWD